MSSLSNWITERRTEYAEAITEAYDNAGGSGDFANAWTTMSGDSAINGLLPPQTYFHKTSSIVPTAGSAEILQFGEWLASNLSTAAELGLAVQTAVDSTQQTTLSTANVVGSEWRRWKGQSVYTFPNGIVVGKNNKLIASFGAEIPGITEGLGDDVLLFFDGLPNSKGTTTPGTTVFNGDMVVSGSLQGSGGIIIIDDVIQLETGVHNPAGIGVNDEGHIVLRHRGEGFLDLVDENERIKNEAIDESKVWVGTQNTNSSRHGSTLIPNGNFSMVTAITESGNLVEFPSGAHTIGYDGRKVGFRMNGSDPDYGVLSFDGSGQTGFIMPAVPITCEAYTITIRYAVDGTQDVNVAQNDAGIYFFFWETSDDSLGTNGNAEHIQHLNSTVIGTNTIDTSKTVHTSNTTEQWLNPSSNPSYPDSGGDLTTAYQVSTFTYNPTKTGNPASLSVKNASFGVYVKNVNTNVFVDYVVMTAKPPLASEVAADIAGIETGIANETGSLVPDAGFPSLIQWQIHPNTGAATTFEQLPEGGDTYPTTPDRAARVNMATITSYCGLLSNAISRDHDKYAVGARIKVDGDCDIEVVVVEETNGEFNAFDTTSHVSPDGTNEVQILTAASSGSVLTNATYQNQHTITAGDGWMNLFGTYTVTGLDTASVNATSSPPSTAVSRFSVLLYIKTAGVNVDVDYVWTSRQTASLDLATALADYAHTNAKEFVTTINDYLVRESGSLIPNASMAMPSTAYPNVPAGYRSYNSTLETYEDPTTGDKSIKVTVPGASGSLISPPFQLGGAGDADKYSVGVLVKSTSGSNQNITLKVAYHTEHLAKESDDNSQSYVTLAPNADEADVFTSSVAVTTRAVEQVTGSYESILMTWNKKTVETALNPDTPVVASVIVEGDGDFQVDYIYVATQAASFDLAEETAEAKRDEAIAMATGALQGLTNGLNQEQGSLLANSSFGSYVYDGVAYQTPKNWAWTRDTTSLHRVVSATEVTSHNGQTGPAILGEVVDNVNQVGACGLVTTGGIVNGILSSYFSLPFAPDSETTFTVDSTDYSPVGKYTLSLKLKVDSANVVGIRLLAHESKTMPDGNQEFILCTSTSESNYNDTTGLSATTRASSIHGNYSTKTLEVNDTTGSTSLIKVINISQDDDQAGYSSSDEYIEFFPVDNSDIQGDLDATVQNQNDWYSVAGTYTPSSGVKFVSFEIIIEDTNAGSGRANVYIDYISLAAQSIDADFASTLAQARTEDLMDNLEDDPVPTGNILANPYFKSSIKRTRAGERPKKWQPFYSGASTYGAPYQNFEFLQSTLKKGLKLGNLNGYDYKGVISTPFRVQSPDYEIIIRAKISDTDSDAKLKVTAYESNSDIDEDWTQVITVNTTFVPVGVNTSLYDGGGSAYSESVTCTHESGDGSLTTSWQTFKLEYRPTTDSDQNILARYASLRVFAHSLDDATELHLRYVKCQVDSPYRVMDRHLSTLFGDGDNLATLLGTPSKVFTGPLGITNISEIKNTNITLTKSGGEFTFNGVGLGPLSASDVGAKSSSYTPSLSEITSGLGITGVNDIKNSQVNQAFIETAMGSGWSKSNSLNSNVVTGEAALGYTPFHSGNRPTKGDVGLGSVEDYSPSGLAALNAFTDNFNKFEASDAVTAAAGMNLNQFSNFGSTVQTGVDRAGEFNSRFLRPGSFVPKYGKNEIENSTFTQVNDTDTDNTFGRPEHFAVAVGQGLRGIMDTKVGQYAGSGINTNLGASAANGTISEYDFSGNNCIGFNSANRNEVHIKSASALIAKGIPLEGGKKYRIAVKARMSFTSKDSNPVWFLNNGANGYTQSDLDNYSSFWNAPTGTTEQLTIGYSQGDTEYSAETNWDMDSAAPSDLYNVILIGVYYITSEPSAGTQYIYGIVDNVDVDVGTGAKGDGEESTYIRLTTSSATEYTATITLPDDAVWGSFFIRRPYRGIGYLDNKNNPSAGRYRMTCGFNAYRHPIFQSVSLQKTSGTGIGTFVSLHNSLAGTSLTISNSIRNTFNLSDRNLKQNIEPVNEAIQTIQALNPVKFEWQEFPAYREIHVPDVDEEGNDLPIQRIPNYGVIAQEIADVLPELVVSNAHKLSRISEGKHGGNYSEIIEYMGVDYHQLIPIVIKAIQEQQEIIDSQRKDIDDLKELVNKLIEDKGDE